jgi:hypothetical protein
LNPSRSAGFVAAAEQKPIRTFNTFIKLLTAILNLYFLVSTDPLALILAEL